MLPDRARQFLAFRTTPGTPYYCADLAEQWAVAGPAERQGILRQHAALLQQQQLMQDEVRSDAPCPVFVQRHQQRYTKCL